MMINAMKKIKIGDKIEVTGTFTLIRWLRKGSGDEVTFGSRVRIFQRDRVNSKSLR